MNSFPSPQKFWFYTDWIVSIEWLNPILRQHICVCFEIHRIFVPEVLLRQCASCKEPSESWFACRFRNFGLSGSEYKYCASWLPLLQDAPNLNLEKCLRVLSVVYLRDC